MNNNSLFDIFDYLGIPVTDDPEVVRKAIDSLKVGTEKYKNLYGNPKFSQIRSKIYTKNNSAFLAYVQEIRMLRQSNQQQNYNQQNYNQQDYNQQDVEFDDYADQLYDQQFNNKDKKATFLGCAFLIFVCFCIIGGIGALFDSGSTTLSNPKVKFNDVDRQSVRISWEPVEHADYYLLKNKSDDLPETEIRNRTEYIVFRHDDRKTEYSLSACSDDEKYKPSSSVKINIESVKNHLQETETETEEEPEVNPEDNYTPSVLTPEPSNSAKTVLDAPKPRIVETKNSVLVLWDVVENADRYLLEIKMGRNGKSFSKVVNDSMYTFSTLKPNKEYFITVTAIPKDEARFSPSPSKTISFTLQPK
ncbi:MAG: fibronectin type III domain-containing protein [Thermoguttaceae bacterium]|nr:fibronectin type III domain-containing protein [Thermoguttaceae bacterium]